MKKIITIILSIVIILTLGCVITIKVINNKKEDIIVNDVIDDLSNHLNNISKHIYSYEGTGNVSVSASYKGAHGEKYPSNYEYTFELNNNEISFENNDIYNTLELDSKVINIYNTFTKIDNSRINELVKYTNKNVDNNIISLSLDKDTINNMLGTNYTNIKIKVYKTGVINKLDHYDIILDDMIISIKDNDIKITYGNDTAEIITNKSGYSANINNNLKMNVYYFDDYTEYNMAVNNNVLYFKTMNNEIVVQLNGEAAIYFGIDLDLVFDENVTLSKLTLDDSRDNNPILRYVDHIDYSFWR